MIEPTPTAFRRCFVAWMLPEQAVEQVNARRHEWIWPAAVKPLFDRDLHVTLHYLGNLDAERLFAVRQALGAVQALRVEICLHQAEIWNHEVAVLCGDATPPMRAAHLAVGDALAVAGCVLDGKRPWRPHATLAWGAGNATAPISPGRVCWRTTGFVLAASASAGPERYQVIDAWPTA